MSTKRKRFPWQPIVFTLIPAALLYMVVSNASYSKKQLNALHGREEISKAELKVVSQAGVNYITLSEAKQLDSINTALQQAKRIRVQTGGSAERWADLNIYKGGKEINAHVKYNPYNGWMIIIGNETLSSEYIFSLVNRYAKK